MIIITYQNLGTHPFENKSPHLKYHTTNEENMMNIFHLLETENATILQLVCDYAFVEQSLPWFIFKFNTHIVDN
jgi:hypothetical protein